MIPETTLNDESKLYNKLSEYDRTEPRTGA